MPYSRVSPFTPQKPTVCRSQAHSPHSYQLVEVVFPHPMPHACVCLVGRGLSRLSLFTLSPCLPQRLSKRFLTLPRTLSTIRRSLILIASIFSSVPNPHCGFQPSVLRQFSSFFFVARFVDVNPEVGLSAKFLIPNVFAWCIGMQVRSVASCVRRHSVVVRAIRSHV